MSEKVSADVERLAIELIDKELEKFRPFRDYTRLIGVDNIIKNWNSQYIRRAIDKKYYI